MLYLPSGLKKWLGLPFFHLFHETEHFKCTLFVLSRYSVFLQRCVKALFITHAFKIVCIAYVYILIFLSLIQNWLQQQHLWKNRWNHKSSFLNQGLSAVSLRKDTYKEQCQHIVVHDVGLPTSWHVSMADAWKWIR